MFARLQQSGGWSTLLLVAREFEAEASRGRGSAAAAAPSAQPASAPRPDQYTKELQLLREMGFVDTRRNLQLLHANNGSVDATLNQLMS